MRNISSFNYWHVVYINVEGGLIMKDCKVSIKMCVACFINFAIYLRIITTYSSQLVLGDCYTVRVIHLFNGEEHISDFSLCSQESCSITIGNEIGWYGSKRC